jgi:hypothetical protein
LGSLRLLLNDRGSDDRVRGRFDLGVDFMSDVLADIRPTVNPAFIAMLYSVFAIHSLADSSPWADDLAAGFARHLACATIRAERSR